MFPQNTTSITFVCAIAAIFFGTVSDIFNKGNYDISDQNKLLYI